MDASLVVCSIPKLLRWKLFCQLTEVVSWWFSVHTVLLPSYFASICSDFNCEWRTAAVIFDMLHRGLLCRSQHNGAILLTALIGSIAETAVNIFIFTCTVLQTLRSRGLFWSSSVTQGYACVCVCMCVFSSFIGTNQIRILLCRKAYYLQRVQVVSHGLVFISSHGYTNLW